MHPLDGPKRKLARAGIHIQTFNDAVQRWYDSKPVYNSRQFNIDKTAYVYTIKVGPPPVDIGVLAGDILHNLRSCLDHLAWQLALLTTSTPYKRTAFPIFLSDNEHSRQKIRELLKDVPAEAREVIESLQPYKSPDGIEPETHGLWLLHQLSNVDKHQIVTIGGAMLEIPNKEGMSGRSLNSRTVEITVPMVDGSVPLPPQIECYLVLGRGIIGAGAPVKILGAIELLIHEGLLPQFEHFFLA